MLENLILITGPSGVGKGSIIKELLKRNTNLWLSVSATTRNPREGEIDGIDYYFLKSLEFKEIISKKGFLEWAEFAGNLYGTPFKQVKEKIDFGKKVLLEIELEGARQVRKSCPKAFQIFIMPPDLKTLEKRIRSRASETEEEISKRLKRGYEEIKAKDEFNAVVVNKNIDNAVIEIESILGEI